MNKSINSDWLPKEKLNDKNYLFNLKFSKGVLKFYKRFYGYDDYYHILDCYYDGHLFFGDYLNRILNLKSSILDKILQKYESRLNFVLDLNYFEIQEINREIKHNFYQYLREYI